MDEVRGKSVFETLYGVDVSGKVKQKNKLNYLSWASSWAEVKKLYPDAEKKTYGQIMDDYGNERFWHDDGVSGWVDVGVSINGKEERTTLAIMNMRNEAIPADQIKSTDANKAQMRCLAKACAMHGLGLYIYEGEDIPESVAEAQELLDEVDSIAKKKAALSDKAKKAVAELCREAEKKAFPDIPDDEITGNYKNIDDVDILGSLKRKLMSVRK